MSIASGMATFYRKEGFFTKTYINQIMCLVQKCTQNAYN